MQHRQTMFTYRKALAQIFHREIFAIRKTTEYCLTLHTYIIGHYNPSVRITAQLLTLLMLCALILYVSGGTYSLTSTPNDRFLRNLFMARLFTLRVFARNLLRGSRRRNISHISLLMTILGYEPRLLRPISQHTTYQTTATTTTNLLQVNHQQQHEKRRQKTQMHRK